LAKSLDGSFSAIIAENLRMLGEKGEILLQGGAKWPCHAKGIAVHSGLNLKVAA
jgi:hypothetical protein